MKNINNFPDISILYNPLLYSNPFFWPPLFLPYSHGASQSPPKSPPTRDYTLTPERDDQNGKFFSHFFFIDDHLLKYFNFNQ